MNHRQQFVNIRKQEGFVFYWHEVNEIKVAYDANKQLSISLRTAVTLVEDRVGLSI